MSLNNMPVIEVGGFKGDTDTFFGLFRNYCESNSQYRGYSKLIQLIESKDLSEYELFEVTCDQVRCGLAAAKLVDCSIIIDVLTVDEEFRGIGVGDALFNAVINYETFKDANNFESMALPGDRSTKNFFEQRKGKASLLIVAGELNRK